MQGGKKEKLHFQTALKVRRLLTQSRAFKIVSRLSGTMYDDRVEGVVSCSKQLGRQSTCTLIGHGTTRHRENTQPIGRLWNETQF